MALNHTNTGADQRKSWARTPALTRTTHGPLKSEYSDRDVPDPLDAAFLPPRCHDTTSRTAGRKVGFDNDPASAVVQDGG